MPTPVRGVPTFCEFHAGMVTRDHLDLVTDAIETRLHAKIAANRAALDAERRRIDVLCGPDGANGKLAQMRKDIDDNTAARDEITKTVNALAIRIVIAAITGGGGLALLQHIL